MFVKWFVLRWGNPLFVTIKGGALLYSLAISLLIGIFSSSLILFAFYGRTALQQYSDMERLQLNTNSAMQLLLAVPEKAKFGLPIEIDLYSEGKDKVTMLRKHWGAFEIAITQATAGKYSNSRAAIIGSNLHNDNKISLYLADNDKPLSLCGSTSIKGICYLPKAGVKRAYIEGQSFSGDKLIDGEIKESKKELPELNKEMVASNQAYLSGQFNPSDSIIEFEKIQESDSITRLFSENTLLVHSKEKIVLAKQYCSGNVIIVSEDAVFIGSGCQVSDVIIYAPFIEVEKSFSGSVQLYASDSLVIGGNSKLKYPSVAGLISKNISSSATMTLQEDAEFSGVLFSYVENSDSKNQSLISIEKGAVVKGQVYSNSAIDLKGKIYGSIACEKFILNTPSSVYENHLLNVTIDYSLLSPYFVGVNLTDKSDNRKIVKWLY